MRSGSARPPPAPAQRAAPSHFFPVIRATGHYLSKQAGIAAGSADVLYLIVPPVEALVAVDAALKTGGVRLLRFFRSSDRRTSLAGIRAVICRPVKPQRKPSAAAVLDVGGRSSPAASWSARGAGERLPSRSPGGSGRTASRR